MITKGKARDSIHAAFILQEGVADAHARDFTADQLDQASRIGDELAGFHRCCEVQPTHGDL